MVTHPTLFAERQSNLSTLKKSKIDFYATKKIALVNDQQ